MTVSVEEYRKLKSKVDERKAAASRAEGAYDEAVRRLREAGCSSVEEAEAKLKQLKAEEVEAEKAYEAEMLKFKEKWGNRLE
jgi:hypothetical protein